MTQMRRSMYISEELVITLQHLWNQNFSQRAELAHFSVTAKFHLHNE